MEGKIHLFPLLCKINKTVYIKNLLNHLQNQNILKLDWTHTITQADPEHMVILLSQFPEISDLNHHT